MPSPEQRCRLSAIGAFTLPIAAVLAFGWMSDASGPAEATAMRTPATSAGSAAGPSGRSAAGGPTPDEQAASRHIALLRQLPFGPSPFYGEQPPPEAVELEEPAAEIEFQVQAILSSPRGNTALIDGRSYREGDRIGRTDWRIVEIDGVARSVTVEHAVTAARQTASIRSR